MKVVFNNAQKKHAPTLFYSSGALQPNPEAPERADVLLGAALESGLELSAPGECGNAPLEAVHSARYLAFLQNIFRRWSYIEGASPEVIPGIHPDRRDCGYPASAAGQAGYHQMDTASPITADTWESACWSAASAVQAATHVIDGDGAAYALARPPGHHATRDQSGGFCYLNNSAIAAQRLRQRFERVAILDVDVHHGNGTQDIFYDRSDVLTVSLHADPVRFYPFFWGYADETGTGEGDGFNLNIPAPRGTGDAEYLQMLETAIRRIREFGADALVVALGLDAYEGDPLRGLAITTPGFARIAEHIARLQLPTVLVQEGGYLSAELGENLKSFLDGFTNTHAPRITNRR